MRLSSRIVKLEQDLSTLVAPVSNNLPDVSVFLPNLNDPATTTEVLVNAFLEFTKFFYQLIYGREYILSVPICRASHHRVIAYELVEIFLGRCLRELIHCPPRYGKTELCVHFVAWTLAYFPDSNYIYTGYGYSLAEEQTGKIRRIIRTPEYKRLFKIYIPRSEKGQAGHFVTNFGGCVFAVGAGGDITGRGAGIVNANRWGGCLLIDDIHKPEEVLSDTSRERIIDWFPTTAQSRANPPKTPILFIGQRLHERDAPAVMRDSELEPRWKVCNIPALDEAGNALDPSKHDANTLKQMAKEWPYMFAAQYQQQPTAPGGSIFKTEWFLDLHEIPKILATFITVDTAETSKTYNDPSVFSAWGLYKVTQRSVELDTYALVWLDCAQLWVEPADLQSEFLSFHDDFLRICVANGWPPLDRIAIEKKSTGVTLLSTLKELQGVHVLDVERSGAAQGKANRALNVQGFFAKNLVTFLRGAKHREMCVAHMSKITANDTHRHDDICDTAIDAVKLALIDKIIRPRPVTVTGETIPGYKAFIKRKK